MKKKQVLAVGSALLIGTTTVLTGEPISVLAQGDAEIVQEVAVEEAYAEPIPAEQTIENAEEKAGSVAIDERNFPDAEFRKYVQEKFDTDKDQSLSQTECADVSGIYIHSNSALQNVIGIEHFSNLTSLILENVNISAVDVSQNKKLNVINFSDMPISAVDISGNTELEYFSCAGTELLSLNVQNNTKLKNLNILNTDIQELNIGNNPLLEYLNCSQTKLTALDVSKNPNLKVLDCQSTNLSSLDVSNNPELYNLNCSATQISQLDISRNAKLKLLYFYMTDIAEIDISNHPELERIGCFQSNVQMLDVSQNHKLIELRAWDTPLVGLNLGNHPNLETTFDSPTSKEITVQGNTFSLPEQTDPRIDLSKVTITSNGTLDKNTGIVTVEGTSKDVTYDYDCGISQKGRETLQVVLKLNAQPAVNTAPTIHAKDVTLYVGDTFDPLAGVGATDQEDGEITLTKENVIANDVNTSKAGTYHVTYKVTDKNKASTEKTITVTVKEKDTQEPADPETPEKPQNPEDTIKPGDTTNTENAAVPSGQSKTPKTGDVSSVGLLGSLLAGSTGVLTGMLGKRRKRNGRD